MFNRDAKISTNQRLSWPDVAKGFGIILVVLGHGLRGLIEANILEADPVWLALDRAIYLFHMPLFFVLAGWFFIDVLQRHSQTTLLVRTAKRLLYPMCVWTYIFIGFKWLAGSASNSPVELSAMLRLPFPGYLHLWFLWALMVSMVIAILFRPMILRAPVWCMLALVCVSSVIYLAQIETPAWSYTSTVVRSAPYVFIGMLVGHLVKEPLKSYVPTIVSSAIALAVFALCQITLWSEPDVAVWLRFALSLLCVGSVLIIAHVPWSARQAWLIKLGQCSMAIYLCHTIVSAGVRILLTKLDVSAPAIHILLGVGLGLIVPVLLYHRRVPAELRGILRV